MGRETLREIISSLGLEEAKLRWPKSKERRWCGQRETGGNQQLGTPVAGGMGAGSCHKLFKDSWRGGREKFCFVGLHKRSALETRVIV